jgi:hypothetical protein
MLKIAITNIIIKLSPYKGNILCLDNLVPEFARVPITGVIYYKCPKL